MNGRSPVPNRRNRRTAPPVSATPPAITSQPRCVHGGQSHRPPGASVCRPSCRTSATSSHSGGTSRATLRAGSMVAEVPAARHGDNAALRGSAGPAGPPVRRCAGVPVCAGLGRRSRAGDTVPMPRLALVLAFSLAAVTAAPAQQLAFARNDNPSYGGYAVGWPASVIAFRFTATMPVVVAAQIFTGNQTPAPHQLEV